MRPRPLRVALTGGIASGKSHCLARFASRGAPVIDADALAREVIAAGTPGAAAVHARFGTLDRARIADVVFHNAQARADLEAIIHPRVYEAIDSWYRLLRNAPFGVADIPLVCETNHVRDFDRIVITACLPEQQLARLEARGLSPEQAQSRMRAQLTVEQKMARAAAVGVPVDVINTSSSIDETDQQVDRLIERLGSLPPRVCS